MRTQSPSLQVIDVNPQTRPIGTVIWLHGLGADGNDFVSLVPELHLDKSLPLRFVFPNAPLMPVTINNGYVMRAWYDIYSLSTEQRIDFDGIHNSAKKIEDIIENEREMGMPANRILLAGFSQGAVMALTVGLKYPERIAGIIALSGYLPFNEENISQMAHANHAAPIFFGHGTHDNVIPYDIGKMGYDLLKKLNYDVSWHSYPIAHGVNDDEVADISKWLTQVY